MTDFVDEAMEVPALIIGDPETGQVGLFAGGVLPNVAAPGAPVNSWFFRNNGEIYKHSGGGDAMADWTKDVLADNNLPGGGGAGVSHAPVLMADGVTIKRWELEADYLPIIMTDGSTKKLELT